MNTIEFYQEQLQDLERVIGAHRARVAQLQFVRGLTALPGLMLIGFGAFSAQAPWGTWQLGLLLMLVFLGVATWQETIRWQLDLCERKRDFFARLVARRARHWDQLPALRTENAISDFRSPTADDLDLFGDRSLYRWLSLATTDSGAKQLARWMTRWSDEESLVERQQAVRYLSRERSWRLAFWDASHAFRVGESRLESMQKWVDTENLFSRYPLLGGLTWIGPVVALLGLASLVGALAYGQMPVAGICFVILLVAVCVNLVVNIGFIGKVNDTFVWIGGANRELQAFSNLLGCIEQIDAPEPLLGRLRSQVSAGHGNATDALRILRFRMRFAGLQRNPLFFLPYVVLQILGLWDFWILGWLETWRAKYGAHLADWIDAVGQIEALSSAATIADEQEGWNYPTWTKELGRGMEIDQLAHPLLPDAVRVANDLRIEDAKPLLLVTGSNMAGKSTLLRSLGVNIALARVGAPVACRAWQSANQEVASSIRVRDSLQDGVSFFMAELNRLKSVVDFAHERRCEKGIPMLVLLDEILQGTNSGERQIAVQSVLEHLVELGCTVVASTHDLDLARSPFMTRTAQVVHFREYFDSEQGREVMRFDYKMRAGVTPTTNALKLLELVGLRRKGVEQ